MAKEAGNTYLEQVVAQQAMLEGDLRARPAAPAMAPAPGGAPDAFAKRGRALGVAPAPVPNAVDVRVSGFWRWKTVLVPPNAFVVHTRRGRAEPLHLGLGVSFRFNPATDTFLVVPGATQTILINAYCICRELQGVLVQGYVQWIIQDFGTAYRKLDFSDADDPMRLVNLQLKEQAEAAIKDKVATLGVHDVLSDKQPIIEELTARLRAVADGLGVGIVTVQIKEAVVSSSRLWENLQKPYRSEQARIARLAELEAEEVISEKEMTAARLKETRRIEHARELTELKQTNDARLFDVESAESARRFDAETGESGRRFDTEAAEASRRFDTETAEKLRRHDVELETSRLAGELEAQEQLARIELEVTKARGAHDVTLLTLERDRIRAEIANERSPASLQAELIRTLPEIVAKLPKPDELRTVNLTGNDRTTLAGLAAELGAVVHAIKDVTGDDAPR
ncbi:SPFH domain-containing protein [Actinocorallia longicatena]|uniref:Band 7 domain-containing protein n=1 Tax=Actinocorallia longicatena TaxID=111803 RepID=A0ABP6Q9B1_9ACTN